MVNKKRYFWGLFLFALCFSVMAFANAPHRSQTPLALLSAMQKSHKQQNYEITYILQYGEEVESFRYRHAFVQEKEYAQLIHLDNGRADTILREHHVSYFSHEFPAFSIKSDHIKDNLPAVYHTDFAQLQNYHFVDVGKMRIADRIARVIRVVPNDNFRYSYTLWIDEEYYLLLKSELIDRNDNVLEQFRVIQSVVDEQMQYIIEPIETLALPRVLPLPENGIQHRHTWHASWIPAGFQLTKMHTVPFSLLSDEEEQAESQFFSDGLASFTLYRVKNNGVIYQDQYWQQNALIIYAQTVGEEDFILIGDIPLSSARHIVQKIEINSPLQGAPYVN